MSPTREGDVALLDVVLLRARLRRRAAREGLESEVIATYDREIESGSAPVDALVVACREWDL